MTKLLIPILLFLLMMTSACKGEEGNPKVQITLDDGRTINLELYPEMAPKAVKNFLSLVDKKYYDGVCFHRIIDNFMIQTGGYYIKDNTIKEKPKTDSIYGEFASNGYENNTLKHELGVISMARTNEKNSASSQFFICSATSSHLDGNYAAFGKTIDDASNQVVLALSAAPTSYIDPSLQNFPNPPIIIKSIRKK